MAGYAAPYQPPREPEPELHVEAEQPPREPEPELHVEAELPGELVGIDCFHVGRLAGTKGSVWQLSALDVASSFSLDRARQLPAGVAGEGG